MESPEGHYRVLAYEKGGIRGMKIIDVNRMRDALVQGRGRRRRTDQCLKSLNKSIVIGGIRS